MVGQATPQAGTPASMRALNQRLVLDRLRGHGEATRPQIASDTGLSKPTVGQALLDLEQHGLVRAIGRSAAGPGRAAVIYRTAPDAGHIVGVDIGRRVIRVAVADLDGAVVARVDQPNRSRSGNMLQRNVCQSVERAIAEAGPKPDDIVVTVVGTPGIPDSGTGTVHRAPNLPGWERHDLLHQRSRAWFRRLCGDGRERCESQRGRRARAWRRAGRRCGCMPDNRPGIGWVAAQRTLFTGHGRRRDCGPALRPGPRRGDAAPPRTGGNRSSGPGGGFARPTSSG